MTKKPARGSKSPSAASAKKPSNNSSSDGVTVMESSSVKTTVNSCDGTPSDEVKTINNQDTPVVKKLSTWEEVFKSFYEHVDYHFNGDIDCFFNNLCIFIQSQMRDDKEDSNEDSNEKIKSFDDTGTSSQVFDSIVYDGDEALKLYLSGFPFPTNQVINNFFTNDMMKESFINLTTKSRKRTAPRKSFSKFINSIAQLQCFLKPSNIDSDTWANISKMTVNYMVDKLFHFLFAKNVVFEKNDVIKTKNEDGSYTFNPSGDIQFIIKQQLKECLRKRKHYHTDPEEVDGEEDEEDKGEEEDEEDEEDQDDVVHLEDEDDSTQYKPLSSVDNSSSSSSTPVGSSSSSTSVGSSSSSTRKVIVTEQFPNCPEREYGFGFFTSVKNNSKRAHLLIQNMKEKKKRPNSSTITLEEEELNTGDQDSSSSAQTSSAAKKKKSRKK